MLLRPLGVDAGPAAREAQYALVADRVALLLDGETDWVAAQATVVAELHLAFECACGCREPVRAAADAETWPLQTITGLASIVLLDMSSSLSAPTREATAAYA